MTTSTLPLRFWWHDDPNVVACDLCGCPIQGHRGRVGEAMRAHFSTCHPKQPLRIPGRTTR